MGPLATDLHRPALAAVPAFAAGDGIGTGVVSYPVVPGTAAQGVVAVTAADPVVTAPAVDEVMARQKRLVSLR